jgi:SAM-dependent methyltransferase
MTDFDRLAQHYDLEHADYLDDLPMYAGFAQATGGDSGAGILELACGTGRCLLPLASAGHTVTGLDVSPAMLAQLQQKAEAAGVAQRVTAVQGDMRDFSLGRTFSLIYIALNSLMHLETQAEQQQALLCAARHLQPGGRLVVDLFSPDVALPDPQQEGQLFLHCLKTLPGGKHLLHFQSPSVDRAHQLVTMANYYDEIDAAGSVKRIVAPFTLRYLTAAELGLLLPTSGLLLDDLYGTYDLEPYQSGSPRLIAVATGATGATRGEP